jgi:hypothetical protein
MAAPLSTNEDADSGSECLSFINENFLYVVRFTFYEKVHILRMSLSDSLG